MKIRTIGHLDNGVVIDKHHAVPFTLGDGDVIQGEWVSILSHKLYRYPVSPGVHSVGLDSVSNGSWGGSTSQS